MDNESIWPGTQTPLYKNGEYVVHNGIVLKCCGGTYIDGIPPYDASAVYAHGDYCHYEGKLYMRGEAVKPQPDGPFNPDNWTEPPIYAVCR